MTQTVTTDPAPETPEPRKYVVHYGDGGLRIMTATQLASDLAAAEYGDTEPVTLWTWIYGEPREVFTRATCSPFGEDDYADVRVELVDSTGHVLDVTGYRIDGRA